MGGYSRWALIRGWAPIKFSPFSASSKLILQQNNNKMSNVPKQNFNCSLKVLVKYGTKKTRPSVKSLNQ